MVGLIVPSSTTVVNRCESDDGALNGRRSGKRDPLSLARDPVLRVVEGGRTTGTG